MSSSLMAPEFLTKSQSTLPNIFVRIEGLKPSCSAHERSIMLVGYYPTCRVYHSTIYESDPRIPISNAQPESNRFFCHQDLGQRAELNRLRCGRGSRTPDLWVMNPTRYHCATPRCWDESHVPVVTCLFGEFPLRQNTLSWLRLILSSQTREASDIYKKDTNVMVCWQDSNLRPPVLPGALSLSYNTLRDTLVISFLRKK